MSSTSSINKFNKKISPNLTGQNAPTSKKASLLGSAPKIPASFLNADDAIYEQAPNTPKPASSFVKGLASPQKKASMPASFNAHDDHLFSGFSGVYVSLDGSVPTHNNDTSPTLSPVSSRTSSLVSQTSSASSLSYAQTFARFKESVEAAQIKTRSARKITPWMTRIGGVTAGLLLFTGHAPVAIAMAIVFPVVGALIAKLVQKKLASNPIVQDFQDQLAAISQSPYFSEIQQTPEFKKAAEIQEFFASNYGGRILTAGLKKSISPIFSIFSAKQKAGLEALSTPAQQQA